MAATRVSPWPTVVALVAVLASNAACSSSDSEAARSLEPADLAGGGEVDAPFARLDDLVGLGDTGAMVVLEAEPTEIVDDESRQPVEATRAGAAALRLADATWRELPDPPPLVEAGLVEVGDTVAVVGLECLDPRCEEAVTAGTLLATDLRSWQPVEFGEQQAFGAYDNGVTPLGQGWIIDVTGFRHLDPDGRVVSATRPDPLGMDGPGPHPAINTQAQVCPVGDRLTSVALVEPESEADAAPGTMRFAVQAALEFDPENPTAGWTTGPSSAPIVLDMPLTFCGNDGPILADGVTELSLSLDAGTWSQRAVGLPPPFEQPLGRTGLWSFRLDDGSVILRGFDREARGSAPLVVRHADGRYVATDLLAEDLFVAGDTAYSVPGLRTDAIQPLDLGD
jgi:hypothetical protein